MNVAPCSIDDTPVEIMSIDYVSKEKTSAMFLAEIIIDIEADTEERSITGTASYDDSSDARVEKTVTFEFQDKTHPVLTFTYKMNGADVRTFIPEQVCHEGKQILHCSFPCPPLNRTLQTIFLSCLKLTGERDTLLKNISVPPSAVRVLFRELQTGTEGSRLKMSSLLSVLILMISQFLDSLKKSVL